MPEIDGLRGLAVLLVVAFHAFPEAVKGGFIGVDIFFVISGYLISTIIFTGLEQGGFRFGDFYARRVRRIFPALILVLAASFAFGWFTLFADELGQLGKHMETAAGFVINFTLKRESGYFDNAADTKPLLHLWSLSIEEQFYIFWPLLLWAAWKRKWNFLTITLVIAAASFGLNLYYTVKNQAIIDFYSPFSRFWELMAGGILAYVTQHKPRYLPPYPAVQSLAGLMLIAIGVVTLDKTSSFPSWHALLPVVGAVLIISAGQKDWCNRHLLSSRCMVAVGLISYPLYLWHWPLLSFSRILSGATPSPEIRAAAVLAAFVLAWLTYLCIEKPVRFGGHRKRNTIILVVLMVVMAGAGYIAHRHDGLGLRGDIAAFNLNDEQLQWHSYDARECKELIGANTPFCLLYGNRQNITTVVIGDSTANALAPGLAHVFANDREGLINIGHQACAPIRTDAAGTVDMHEQDCGTGIDKAYSYILKTDSIKTVVIAFFTQGYSEWKIPGIPLDAPAETKMKALAQYLARDIAELTRHGKHVIVTYDVLASPVSARDCAERPITFAGARPQCDITDESLKLQKSYEAFFDRTFADTPDVCIFRQSQLLMPAHTLVFAGPGGRLYLRDNFHLSYHGAETLAELLKHSACHP